MGRGTEGDSRSERRRIVTTLATPLTTGRALWLAIPLPVRLALRARVPLSDREHGNGDEALIVSVGCGVPLRLLEVSADSHGTLLVRLYELRQRIRLLACIPTTADALTGVLQKLAREHGLSN